MAAKAKSSAARTPGGDFGTQGTDSAGKTTSGRKGAR